MIGRSLSGNLTAATLGFQGRLAGAGSRFHGRVEDDAMNPAAWVERHARRQPDEPALADGGRVHASWSEFATRMAGAAAGLRDHFGLSPGDRVAIVMRNRPEYLEALYAIWHAGLAAVPVNARLHRAEIAYILEHSESAAEIGRASC